MFCEEEQCIKTGLQTKSKEVLKFDDNGQLRACSKWWKVLRKTLRHESLSDGNPLL